MTQNPIHLPVIETVKAAWSRVHGAKAAMWGVLVCIIILRVIMAGINKVFAPESEMVVSQLALFLVFGIGFVLLMLSTVLNWCLIYLGILRASDQTIHFNQAKYVFNLEIFFKMIGAIILKVLILLPAIILLYLPKEIAIADGRDPNLTANTHGVHALFFAACYIVGLILGVFLSLRLWLTSAFVLMNKANPWLAVKLSFHATRSNVFRLIGLFILNGIILMVSAIPVGIGLIWTLPYVMINYGVVFRTLVPSAQKS